MIRALVVAGLVALAAPAGAQVLVPEGVDFHNGSTLPLVAGPEAEELLDRLDNALAVTDPVEAAFVLRALRARTAPDLVRLGPRTHVPALEAAARRLVAAESARVREQVLAEARDALARHVRERDLPALLDHATRGVALPTAREAARLAARFLFERGSWWAARVLAERAGERELAAAAAARLPTRAEPTPWSGPWAEPYVARADSPDRVDASGPPAARELPDGAVLLADDGWLQPIELRDARGGPRWTAARLVYEDDVLGLEALRLSPPTPRAHGLAGPVSHLVQAFNVPVWNDWRSPAADREARLLCLDLTGPAPAKRWSRRVALDAERGVSTAAGLPLVLDDRVLAATWRVGVQTRVHLTALDLPSGEPLFDVPLASAPVVPRFASRQAEFDPADLDKRAPLAGLLERDGVVYVPTGKGVLAAVDALTGWPRFAFRYDRLFALDRDTYDRAYLFDTGGWDDEPVRAFGERLIVAPSDSRYLYSLAPLPGPRGHLVLEDPLERLGRRHVVGLRPDPRGGDAPALLFTEVWRGRAGVVLVGLDRARLAESPRYPDGEALVARPVLAGDVALVPTTAGVRVHRLADLDAEAHLLALPNGAAPIARLAPLSHGLLALCPDSSRRRHEVHLVWWGAAMGR